MNRHTARSITRLRRLGWILLAVLTAARAGAQLTVGENIKMNLNGSVGYGYTGGFGSVAESSHGQSFNLDATLTGSYYHPNFISFTLHPFYDRDQSNGVTGVLGTDNGVETSVGFFGGSHFPGSVSFGKAYGNGTEYGLPGGVGIETNSSSQNFTVTWAELVPHLPPVYANFGINSNSYSMLGADDESHASTKFFSLNTNYLLKGFVLTGNFNHQNQDFTSPTFLGVHGGSTGSTGFGFGASHTLPIMHGNFGASFGHSRYDGEGGMTGSNTSMGAGAGFQPLRRMSLNTNVQYDSSVSGALAESLGVGSTLPLLSSQFDSSSLRIGMYLSFDIGHGFMLNGQANTTRANFMGREFSNTRYGGSVSYRHSQRFLGTFNWMVGVVDMANQQGNSGASLVSSIGMSRKVHKWETSADFGYSQSMQTVAGFYTTSSLSYGGSLRRVINQVTYWSASYRAAHSALVEQAGSSSGTESISSNFTWKRYGVGGGYSRSDGTSVVTASGLLNPTPLAALIWNDLVLYNARSLSVNGNVAFRRGLTVSASYSKAHSDTTAQLLHSFTFSDILNIRAEYKLRKVSLLGGFRRINQQLGASSAAPVGAAPLVVDSYYVRISRWFNVF